MIENLWDPLKLVFQLQYICHILPEDILIPNADGLTASVTAAVSHAAMTPLTWSLCFECFNFDLLII